MDQGIDTDLISMLISSNIEEPLIGIFMNLQPRSLHISRQVCKKWNQFIVDRIWKNRPIKKYLKKRLNSRWKGEEPKIEDIRIPQYIRHMKIRNDTVIIGEHMGRVRVMDRNTGTNKFILNHDDPSFHDDFLCTLIIDCSDEIIVTISTGRTTENKLIVWNYKNGKKLITFLPQIEKKPSKEINSVKIMNDRILTGGREGHLIVMRIERNEEDEPNGIMIENIMNDKGKLIHEVDAHDNIPSTFTENTIKTWNIKEGTCINVIRIQNRTCIYRSHSKNS